MEQCPTRLTTDDVLQQARSAAAAIAERLRLSTLGDAGGSRDPANLSKHRTTAEGGAAQMGSNAQLGDPGGCATVPTVNTLAASAL